MKGRTLLISIKSWLFLQDKSSYLRPLPYDFFNSVRTAVKKKREKMRGSVDNVRMTQNRSLKRRRMKASLRAANQSRKTLTQRQRSKRKR